jgi:hypothetical protein
MSTATREATVSTDVNLDGIGDDLRAIPRWVHWRPVPKANGKIDKIPTDPATSKNIDSTAESNWKTFDDAVATLRPGLGIGIVLNGDGLIGIDLDECVDADGTLTEDAAADVAAFGSCAMFSPSSLGIRIITRGVLPPKDRKNGPFEIYDRDRFLTITGNRVPGASARIAEAQEAIDAFHTKYIARPEPEAQQPTPTASAPTSDEPDDTEVIRRVRCMAKGRQLFDAGDTTGYKSKSEADLGLLNCFISTGVRSPDRLEALYAEAALDNPHWQKSDYRNRTIAKALNGVVVPYDWNQPTATLVRGTIQQSPSPTSDPCAPVRDELAELRAENAALKRELAQVKRDLSAVIKVIGNPNLGGDAAGKALVLAATHVQWQRARVPSDDGYYRVTASKIADNREWVDGEDGERIPVPVPAQVAPRTVTKYMAIAQERGLIPAEKRTVRVPKGEGDFPVDVWHWKAAPTLADQLAPLTGGTVYDEENPRPIRGGDPKKRRLAPIPGCPECGNHQVCCTSCAAIYDAPAVIDLDTRETLTADEADQALEERRHTVPTRVRPIPSVVTPSNGETSLQSARKAPESGRLTAWRSRFARAADDLQSREQDRQDEPEIVAGTVGRAENQLIPGMDSTLPDRYAEYAPGAD